MKLSQISKQLKEQDATFINLTKLNRTYAIDFIRHLKCIMFPNLFASEVTINQLYLDLKEMLENIKHPNVKETLDTFFEQLPNIKTILLTDVEAFVNGDPACQMKEEIIFTYNSFFAIFIYRIANLLDQLKVKLIPRFLSEYAHSYTGIDINPKATIGQYFFIDHGTGIVIGETTIIGNRVSIYQGVTLGAINLKNAETLKEVKRHPTIKDNVTIYANATILGGNTIIGENSIIGASCFITKSVEPNSKISFI